MLGDPTGFQPCTPAGIRELLVRSKVKTDGAEVVILGRGNIVGKPMAAMLCQKAKGANATVTICHSGTRDIRGALPPRGHFDCRDGRRRICEGRHGQTRGDGD